MTTYRTPQICEIQQDCFSQSYRTPQICEIQQDCEKQLIFYQIVLTCGCEITDNQFDRRTALTKEWNRLFDEHKLWDKNRKHPHGVLTRWNLLLTEIDRLTHHMEPYKELNELLDEKILVLKSKIRALKEYCTTGVLHHAKRSVFGTTIITTMDMSWFEHEDNAKYSFLSLFDDAFHYLNNGKENAPAEKAPTIKAPEENAPPTKKRKKRKKRNNRMKVPLKAFLYGKNEKEKEKDESTHICIKI